MPEVVHWNYLNLRRAGTGPVTRWIPKLSRLGNFGDLLGPLIVRRMVKHLRLGRARSSKDRLLAVGSIMRLAQPGDTIWGAGINGKSLGDGIYPQLDIRAVRGPVSAEVLRATNPTVPGVYGDPALLIPHLWSDAELGIERGSGGVVVMPNYNDLSTFPPDAVSPLGNPRERIRMLGSATRVVASSLHALVIAEAYGVPAVLVTSGAEHDFKYRDYYEGTGRTMPVPVDIADAGDAEPAPPITSWSAEALLDAFPRDLWGAPRTNRV
ncbi:MAG TPA: polysaccharide pyruvyl transferase family protein [Pseudolysinimonas sp.]|jgi:pyruvyltransferase|nr:polysaccharide pyruvyl transferase family protein [Pseudolysinimonas sp.]